MLEACLEIFFRLYFCYIELHFISRFKVLKWLTFDPDYSVNQDLLSGSGFAKYCYLDPEQEKAMLEGALKLLLTLLTIKTHLGEV